MKKRLFGILLSVAMITTSLPVYAVENTNDVFIGDVIEDSIENEVISGNDEVVDENEEIISESEEIAEDTESNKDELVSTDETDSASADKTDKTDNDLGYHGMSLSTKDIQAKMAISEVLSDIETKTPDVDYDGNRITYMADTKEEAEKIANSYNADLVFYEYGIASAVVDFTKKINYISSDNEATVESVIPTTINEIFELAADTSNNLPAVYPEYIYQIEDFDIDEINDVQAAEIVDNSVNALSFSTNDPYLNGQYFHEYIKDYKAWEAGFTGQGVVVAVVDTGVNLTHPDLKNKLTEYRYNSIADDDEYGPYYGYYDNTDAEDDQGHGSHCSGIVAAEGNNSIGGIGVAPDAKIMPIKTMNSRGQGASSWIAAGIKAAADHGADVLSLSLGGSTADPVEKSAVAYAINKGCIFVAAAGNESSTEPSYPACFNDVISVGSLAPMDDYTDRAYSTNSSNKTQTGFNSAYAMTRSYDTTKELVASRFTNYYDSVVIAAPGSNILSTYMNSSSCYNYFVSSGTSQATPQVAGIAALILSASPGIKNINSSKAQKLVKDAMVASSDKKVYSSPVNTYVVLNCGLINVEKCIDMAGAVGEKPEFYGYILNEDGTVKSGETYTLGIKSNSGLIYYTDDGKDPRTAGKIYNGLLPLRFSGKKTFKAVVKSIEGFGEVVTFNKTFRADITSLTMETKKVSVIPGKSAEITVSYAPSYAVPKFEYISDNPDIFTTTAKGQVKAGAKAIGGSVATITVLDTYSQRYVSIPATVVENPITEIALPVEYKNAQNLSVVNNAVIDGITYHNTFNLKNLLVENGNDFDLMTIKSSKPAIVSYSNGILTAHKPGKANITVTANDGSNKKATIKLNVISPVTDITITTDTGFESHSGVPVTAPLGNEKATVKLKPVFNIGGITPTNKKVKYTSSDDSVLTVSNSGAVKPAKNVAEGATATVTAEALDGTGKVCSINFKIYPVVQNIGMFVPSGRKYKYSSSVTLYIPTEEDAYIDYANYIYCNGGDLKGKESLTYLGDTSYNNNYYYITLKNESKVSIVPDSNELNFYSSKVGNASAILKCRDGSNRKLTLKAKFY